MAQLLERLRVQAGETMTETLVSILVSALALTVLATVIATSVNIVTKSRDHLNAFYEAESNMVSASEDTRLTLTIGVPLEAGQSTVDVIPYSSGKDSSIVYYERSSKP